MSDSEDSELDRLLSSPVEEFQDAQQWLDFEATDLTAHFHTDQNLQVDSNPDPSEDQNITRHESQSQSEEEGQNGENEEDVDVDNDDDEDDDRRPPKKKHRIGQFESKAFSELAMIRRDSSQLLETLDQEHRSDLAVHLYALYLISMNNSNPVKFSYVRRFCRWPLKNPLNIPRQSGYEYINESNILQERSENLITVNEFVARTTTQGSFTSNVGVKKNRKPKYCDIEAKKSLDEFTPTRELYSELDVVFEKHIHKRVHENRFQNGVEMQPIIDPPIKMPQVTKRQVVSKLNNTLDEMLKGYASKIGSTLDSLNTYGMNQKLKNEYRVTWSNISLCNDDVQVHEKLERLFRFKRGFGEQRPTAASEHIHSYYDARRKISKEDESLFKRVKEDVQRNKSVRPIQMLPILAQKSKLRDLVHKAEFTKLQHENS